MATTYTDTIALAKMATSDPFDVSLLNGNADTVDTAIKKAYQGRAAHNLLDNSDFTNPINQRGETTYAASGYTIDRWRTWDDGAVSVNDGYISHETPIYQTIGVKLDPAKSYTIAVMNTAGKVTVASGVLQDDVWGHGINIQYNNGDSYARIYGDDHVKNTVWAALYEGTYTADTLPAHQPKGYAAELAECQRYFLRIGNGYYPCAHGVVLSSTDTWIRGLVYTPTKMRINPTVTVNGDISTIRCTIGSKYAVVTKIEAQAHAEKLDLGITLNNAIGTDGVFYMYTTSSDTKIDFSADL